jgi:hypothetical protein
MIVTLESLQQRLRRKGSTHDNLTATAARVMRVLAETGVCPPFLEGLRRIREDDAGGFRVVVVASDARDVEAQLRHALMPDNVYAVYDAKKDGGGIYEIIIVALVSHHKLAIAMLREEFERRGEDADNKSSKTDVNFYAPVETMIEEDAAAPRAAEEAVEEAAIGTAPCSTEGRHTVWWLAMREVQRRVALRAVPAAAEGDRRRRQRLRLTGDVPNRQRRRRGFRSRHRRVQIVRGLLQRTRGTERRASSGDELRRGA